MKILMKYFLLIIFVLGQIFCAKQRTYVLADTGKIKRDSDNQTKYIQTLGLHDIDYYLMYKNTTLTAKDTVELKVIIDKFISVIKKKKFIAKKHLDKYHIVMQNDTIGHLTFDLKGSRDFSASFDLNLKRGQMHYLTTSGF